MGNMKDLLACLFIVLCFVQVFGSEKSTILEVDFNGEQMTKSLHVPQRNMLAKYYTDDIRSALGSLKSPHGMTLDRVVRSGLENPDSSIGVYAGDRESYDLFSPLFDPIIQDYHNISTFPILSLQTTNHDNFLKNGVFRHSKNNRILSTRIRVARNLAEYAFPALISKEDRIQSCEKIKKVLSQLSGELKGTYYSLENMAEENRVQLVKDHFLFKKGDRFLESGGINRDWPIGRGIFHNDQKTFLVWTHEEDVLRIISMQQGGDFAQVFNRLAAALSVLDKELNFAKNEKLGYLTSCPTNLGTAMRASVHIRLPLVSQRQDFQRMCREMGLSVRGIDGEHSERSGDGIFDISNRGRLGKSEHEYLKILYDGVQKLIAMEEEAEKSLLR